MTIKERIIQKTLELQDEDDLNQVLALVDRLLKHVETKKQLVQDHRMEWEDEWALEKKVELIGEYERKLREKAVLSAREVYEILAEAFDQRMEHIRHLHSCYILREKLEQQPTDKNTLNSLMPLLFESLLYDPVQSFIKINWNDIQDPFKGLRIEKLLILSQILLGTSSHVSIQEMPRLMAVLRKLKDNVSVEEAIEQAEESPWDAAWADDRTTEELIQEIDGKRS